ncbi:MAG: hypothetical protein ACI9P5_004517 [Saprospiraceae bacterium]|jgi:hypothetical protein
MINCFLPFLNNGSISKVGGDKEGIVRIYKSEPIDDVSSLALLRLSDFTYVINCS